ncbi:MAG: hypothetical protein E3J72_12620 [Planctomycetota bacterium]|nr:MAG: hypothetical protein E3J72_12620 [Planctomycetota bacterium]
MSRRFTWLSCFVVFAIILTIAAGCKGRSKNRYYTPQVAKIDITPPDRTVPQNQLLQYTATVTYMNGTIIDGTGLVTWSSSDVTVATISNAPGYEGLLTAVSLGNAAISASFDFKTASTSVTVSDAILTAITIAPDAVILPEGRSQQLAAIGTFSDASTFDVTLGVTWSSENAAIAEVSDTYPTKGMVTGRSVGTAQVDAALGVIGNSADITVTPRILEKIYLNPWNPVGKVGDVIQFTAMGVYSDKTTENLTTSVTWYSSQPSIATVSNNPSFEGEASCKSAGKTFIQAVLGAVSNSTELTVTMVSFVEKGGEARLDALGNASDITVFDYDTDGFIDIYVTNYIESNRLFRNDGHGIFSDKTISAQVSGGIPPLGQSPTTGATWADFNSDGFIDLFMTNGSPHQNFSWPNLLFQNPGTAVFGAVVVSTLIGDEPTQAATWGDYDNDGDIDCYVVNGTTAPGPNPDKLKNFLYQNNGTGVFTDVTAAAGVENADRGFAAAFVDVNGDGLLDLYVANVGSTNRLFLNQGLGLFQDYSTQSGTADASDSYGFAFGDYNNDGRPDLYVVNGGASSSNRLYRNTGGGVFADVASAAGVADAGEGRCCAWGDFDSDGYLDLYVVNTSSGGAAINRLYRNNKNGTFTDLAQSSGVPGGGYGVSTVWGDFDLDGDLDLYVANTGSGLNARNLYYRNEGTGGKHWVAVVLDTSLSAGSKNRFSVGARVDVQAGALSMTRWVIATDSHGGAAPAPLFFGLDDNTKCTVAVNWPSGKTQVLPGLQDGDRVIIVMEQ